MTERLSREVLEAVRDLEGECVRHSVEPSVQRSISQAETVAAACDTALSLYDENERINEKVDWWQDMMTGLTAIIDGHYLCGGPISADDRLRQIQGDLHDMGAEWLTEWTSDNQRLAERAEKAEAELSAALKSINDSEALVAQMDDLQAEVANLQGDADGYVFLRDGIMELIEVRDDDSAEEQLVLDAVALLARERDAALTQVATLREALDQADRAFYGWSFGTVTECVEKMRLIVRAALAATPGTEAPSE